MLASRVEGTHRFGVSGIENSINIRPRRSASAEASRRAQQQRIDAMSVEERVKSALSMRERFSWLQRLSKEK